MNVKQAVTGKISAAKAGLIVLLLFAIWVVFIVLSARKETPLSRQIHRGGFTAETKLHSLGLPDNPDLDALPEVFAIWADKAEWKDGKTRFAYWHPGMKTYSYYFEATRSEAGVHFEEISEPHDLNYLLDDNLPDDCPIRFYHFEKPSWGVFSPIVPPPALEAGTPPKPQVEVTLPKISSLSFEAAPINAQPSR